MTSPSAQNVNPKEAKKTTRKLVESAMLIAAATILSLVKLVDLPYGGSVTLASMLPIVIIAYRYGTAWGLLCGLVDGVIQLLLGMNTLSYVTGAASVIAVVLLDYIVAFGVIGLSGLAHTRNSTESSAFLLGSLLGCFLRYVCHVISGCTVWAGLSIPTTAAFQYSLIYNATYMVPETLVLLIVAYYISTSLDFSGVELRPAVRIADTKTGRILSYIAGLVLAAAAVFDVAAVFSKLQNAETGEFDITAISTVSWTWVIIVSAIAVAIAVVLFIVRKNMEKSSQKTA